MAMFSAVARRLAFWLLGSSHLQLSTDWEKGCCCLTIRLRYETDLRYVVGLKSVLVLYLDIPSTCVAGGISGSAGPLFNFAFRFCGRVFH